MYLKGGRIHHEEGAMNYHHTERGGVRGTNFKQNIENTGSTKKN